tara:strand:+ start:424 stop:702 length:279 start_codon:yes stop_codon:yes gene_type:complete
MHPDPIANQDRYNDWDNPYYIAGFSAACETFKATDTDLDKANQRITYQENCIKLLNDNITELEDTIYELNQPWYIKLWNQIPRFSLSIRRTN